jgi:hypothetical protein
MVGVAGEGRVWHGPEKVSSKAKRGGRHLVRNWSGVLKKSCDISREI